MAKGQKLSIAHISEVTMSNVQPDEISKRLIENTKHLNYGTVAVILKIHEGQIVSVSHETTEIKRKQEVIK
jgi:hypothetical protein